MSKCFFLHDFRREGEELVLVESSDVEANTGSGDGKEYFLTTDSMGMYAATLLASVCL